MARIFTALALLSLGMLVTNIALGLRTGDVNGLAKKHVELKRQLRELEKSESAPPQELESLKTESADVFSQIELISPTLRFHVLFGVATALVTLLINSITVTYFIGTSRWCKEVVDTYHLDNDLAQQCTELKRKTFPWACGGIVVLIAIVFLGGASIPSGSNAANSANWVIPHYALALAGTMLIGISFFVQIGNISENYGVIQEILRQVQEIRVERGLEIKGESRDESQESREGQGSVR